MPSTSSSDGRIELRHVDAEAHREVIEEIGAGRCFGELALLGGRTRQAQATVLDRAELLFLTRYDFERVLAMRPALGVKVLAALSVAPAEGELVGDPTGSRIVAFCAGRGGVGCTTVAVATAVALAEAGAGKVCYVDLDVQFGTTGFHERNASCRPLDVLVEMEDLEDHDDEEILAFCCRRGTHLWHVPPPGQMRAFDQYPGRDVVRLLARLKRCFDWVIVDVAPVLEDMALAVLDFADRLVAVGTPSRRDRQATERLFGVLRGYRYGESKFALVVNRGIESNRPFQLGGGDLPSTCFTIPHAEDREDPDEESFWRLRRPGGLRHGDPRHRLFPPGRGRGRGRRPPGHGERVVRPSRTPPVPSPFPPPCRRPIGSAPPRPTSRWARPSTCRASSSAPPRNCGGPSRTIPPSPRPTPISARSP